MIVDVWSNSWSETHQIQRFHLESCFHLFGLHQKLILLNPCLYSSLMLCRITLTQAREKLKIPLHLWETKSVNGIPISWNTVLPSRWWLVGAFMEIISSHLTTVMFNLDGKTRHLSWNRFSFWKSSSKLSSKNFSNGIVSSAPVHHIFETKLWQSTEKQEEVLLEWQSCV